MQQYEPNDTLQSLVMSYTYSIYSKLLVEKVVGFASWGFRFHRVGVRVLRMPISEMNTPIAFASPYDPQTFISIPHVVRGESVHMSIGLWGVVERRGRGLSIWGHV